MTTMMEALADVPQVLLLTIDVPRDWTAGNNALIYDTANTYPERGVARLGRPRRRLSRGSASTAMAITCALPARSTTPN